MSSISCCLEGSQCESHSRGRDPTSANGKVSGAGGAAELLGMKPTTLTSRLQKWGVDPRQYRQRGRKSAPTNDALD